MYIFNNLCLVGKNIWLIGSVQKVKKRRPSFFGNPGYVRISNKPPLSFHYTGLIAKSQEKIDWSRHIFRNKSILQT